MSKEYVVVTTVQTFRHRYVVPIDKLQEKNTGYQADPKWALDCVVMEEVKEFSQLHLGEQILDMAVVNEDEVLKLFDSDNEYLTRWDKEYKLDWINNCWEGEIEPQELYHNYLSRKHKESDTVE
jgi:hypothetical protein